LTCHSERLCQSWRRSQHGLQPSLKRSLCRCLNPAFYTDIHGLCQLIMLHETHEHIISPRHRLKRKLYSSEATWCNVALTSDVIILCEVTRISQVSCFWTLCYRRDFSGWGGCSARTSWWWRGKKEAWFLGGAGIMRCTAAHGVWCSFFVLLCGLFCLTRATSCFIVGGGRLDDPSE